MTKKLIPRYFFEVLTPNNSIFKDELLSTSEKVEIRSADLPEADENDDDFNPCDASIRYKSQFHLHLTL